MKWNVLLFAHLKEAHGNSVEIEAEPTVNAVLEALKNKGLTIASSRLAADNEFVREGESLKEGAELALIPPVSGG